MLRINFTKKSIKTIPQSAGVYLFKDKQNTVIYVGKAKNLKNRLETYFLKDLEPKTSRVVKATKTFSFIAVNSEFEALLLEAKLVRKYQPKYNIQLKDDKSPIYVGITKEEYPRVILLRKTQLDNQKLEYTFGPFINSSQIKNFLKFVRRTFPFSTHKPGRRPCIYSQLGLCEPCPSKIINTPSNHLKISLQKKYRKNIKGVVQTFKGKFTQLKNSLEKQMHLFASKNNFEEAQKIRAKIKILEHISAPKSSIDSYIENPNFLEDIRKKETLKLKQLLFPFLKISKIERIECFDVSHTFGSYPTASMVTFIKGIPEKNLYRRFAISTKKLSDVKMLQEVFVRRKKHFEDWGRPDLIVVDGGKPQLSAAFCVFSGEIAVIGLAKRLEKIILKTQEGFKELSPKGEALYLLQRLRDEAHRFAKSYHKKLIFKALKS